MVSISNEDFERLLAICSASVLLLRALRVAKVDDASYLDYEMGEQKLLDNLAALGYDMDKLCATS